MKNLTVKNIAILSAVLCVVGLTSCNKSTVSPTDVTAATTANATAGGGTGSTTNSNTTNVAVTQANLLSAITTYLTTNYSGYTFVNAYSEATSGTIVNYDVNIIYNSVSYHVVFSAAGAFVSVQQGGGGNGKGGPGNGATPTTNVAVTQANLLSAISTYLTTNYSGYTFVDAYSEAISGTIVNYDVDITYNSVAYHVVFSATGTFVSVQQGGKGNHNGPATTNVAVTQANLLSAISTYLTTNYSGYTFVNAYSESTNGTIANYDVNITYNSVSYHVVFTAAGVFVSATTGGAGKGSTTTTNVAVTQANLLAAITTYLNANYSGYTFVNAYSEASNGTIANYDVNITYNGKKYHVVFTATGTFVSVS